MKGATTGELAARAMNVDSITNTISIGASQNFLRTFRKSQSSVTRDISCPPAAQGLILKTGCK